MSKKSNKQSKLKPKANRKRRTGKPNASRMKQIRAEINEKEMKETIAKNNKSKISSLRR